MRVLLIFAVLFFLSDAPSLADHADTLAVDIRVEPDRLDTTNLVLTSHEDSIMIRAIRINRGNCRPYSPPKLPITLRFGESKKLYFFTNMGYFGSRTPSPSDCQPIKVDISTDKGDYTASLRRASSGDRAGLEADLEYGERMGYRLVLTSHNDSITVRTIRINRGNCKPAWPPRLPVTLRFGDRLIAGVFEPSFCLPIEAVVSTDEGDYTFFARAKVSMIRFGVETFAKEIGRFAAS
jgi:hypothetical protein